jgi:hypothetical protein
VIRDDRSKKTGLLFFECKCSMIISKIKFYTYYIYDKKFSIKNVVDIEEKCGKETR